MLCAFSGQPDKLVQQVTNDNFRHKDITKLYTQQRLWTGVKRWHCTVRMQHVDRQHCLEIKWRTTSPSVSGKHIIGMSEAIAARQGTMGQFLFIGLPGKGQPIDGRLLLSFGSKWTTACTAVGCVFSRYMALSITSNNWTPTRETNGGVAHIVNLHIYHWLTQEKCNLFTFICHRQNRHLTTQNITTTSLLNCKKNWN